MKTLSEAARQYIVYLKALNLPKERQQTYIQGLSNILWFYGKQKELATFDEPTILQYVKVNDPFDSHSPEHERGDVFCSFTHWLMVNQLIPAWSGLKDSLSDWVEVDEHYIPGAYNC